MKPGPASSSAGQSPPDPSLPGRLRAGLFFKISAEDRAEFATILAVANVQRAKFFAAFALVLNIGCALLPATPLEMLLGRASPQEGPPAVAQAGHAALAIASLVYLVLTMLRGSPAAPVAGRSPTVIASGRYRGIGFAAGMVIALAALRILPQPTPVAVPAYLLGVATFATGFFTSPRFSATVLSVVLAIIVAGTAARSGFHVEMERLLFGAGYLGCFWVVSRYVYATKSREVAQLRTIARQTAALELSNTRLREANMLKGELLEIAAHDLRDPLHSIHGLTQILRDELPRDLPARDLVLGISESSQRMAAIVENLLVHVENEAVQIQLRREPADLAALVASVIADHRTAALAKRIDVRSDTAPTTPVIAHVDPQRARQIFENLVSNAVKYSPHGAAVHCLLVSTPDGGHRFSVRDEGPGLTTDDQRRMFTKFLRLTARPTGGETSTGLGLAIVKNLVELHGGRVWAESDGPGKGSTFHVFLPPDAPDTAAQSGSDVRM